jgi:hypothetical protein
MFERTKMTDDKRKEAERRDELEYIEQWKARNRAKSKKKKVIRNDKIN